MLNNDLFAQELLRYAEEATSSEAPLLTYLRQETAMKTEAEHMITGPIIGKLLSIFTQLIQAKTCLEIGTFTGYSALHIASSLPPEGRLITYEINKKHAEIAQKYFNASPHGHKIEMRTLDAAQDIAHLEMNFDLIFVDADKAQYPLYYDTLIPRLRVQGLMLVDNALWQGKVVDPQDKKTTAIHTLNMNARHDPRVETVMLTIRDGLLLIKKINS